MKSNMKTFAQPFGWILIETVVVASADSSETGAARVARTRAVAAIAEAVADTVASRAGNAPAMEAHGGSDWRTLKCGDAGWETGVVAEASASCFGVLGASNVEFLGLSEPSGLSDAVLGPSAENPPDDLNPAPLASEPRLATAAPPPAIWKAAMIMLGIIMLTAGRARRIRGAFSKAPWKLPASLAR
jgi:hypothetical protein